jgi:rSAM/selenodomain-associated transferase 2
MRISVIIPTLNEEACLPGTLLSVRALQPLEIIVVDGGSTDGTVASAQGADLVLAAPRGRAVQMNHAARHARGELLLFLHADCFLEPGALEAARLCFRTPNVAGCCFRQEVLASPWLYRCVDWCAGMRVRVTGLAYGDQGLCIRREVFSSLGGFPELPFMEDLFFARRLRKRGRVVVAPARVFVSPRRWRQAGILKQTIRNWSLTLLAEMGMSPQRLARHYPIVR